MRRYLRDNVTVIAAVLAMVLLVGVVYLANKQNVQGNAASESRAHRDLIAHVYAECRVVQLVNLLDVNDERAQITADGKIASDPFQSKFTRQARAAQVKSLTTYIEVRDRTLDLTALREIIQAIHPSYVQAFISPTDERLARRSAFSCYRLSAATKN